MLLGIWLALVAVLTVLVFVTDEREGARAPAGEVAPVPVVAERVGELRGFGFREVPRPERVSVEVARREGLAALDRDYPLARRRADEDIYELLGLVPEGFDFREAAGSIFGEQVAGYYDPREKLLRIVEGSDVGSHVLAETILAHELVHALEDQRFGLDMELASSSGDPALAYAALVEGTATTAMFAYGRRHFGAEELVGGLLSSVFAPTGNLPGFIQAQLVFPYVEGAAFVGRLLEEADGRWTLADYALDRRPPQSSEHVLHPGKYLRFEAPEEVTIAAGQALGEGWRKAAAGSFGEWQTAQLLSEAGGVGHNEAAAGWGGDRYEFWRRGEDTALVIRWTWDTARDRQEFREHLGRVVAEGGLRGGASVLAAEGGAVTLAIAPDAALASRLAHSGR